MSRRFIYTKNNNTEASTLTIEYLLVGGGSAGQNGGPYTGPGRGGRGGSHIIGTTTISLGFSSNILIGSGGTLSSSNAMDDNKSGGDTIFNSLIAKGGISDGNPYTGNGGANGKPGKNGYYSSISGTGYYYGAGGGDGRINTSATYAGGLTGGGRGGTNYGPIYPIDASFYGAAGGGGGGGNSGGYYTTGSIGYKGVAIIRYLGSQVATGGTITSSGGYTIHTFSTNGTFSY